MGAQYRLRSVWGHLSPAAVLAANSPATDENEMNAPAAEIAAEFHRTGVLTLRRTNDLSLATTTDQFWIGLLTALL